MNLNPNLNVMTTINVHVAQLNSMKSTNRSLRGAQILMHCNCMARLQVLSQQHPNKPWLRLPTQPVARLRSRLICCRRGRSAAVRCCSL